MPLRIEIHEQPERKRYWAEIEVGGMIARRREIVTPQEAGLSGVFADVMAAVDEMLPKPKVPEAKFVATVSEFVAVAAAGDTVAWHLASGSAEDPLAALRAEAEAAGIEVDRRWKEARLRREIAAAKGDGDA